MRGKFTLELDLQLQYLPSEILACTVEQILSSLESEYSPMSILEPECSFIETNIRREGFK